MGFVSRPDITSWGRVIRQPQRVARPAFRDAIGTCVAARPEAKTCLAVGLRRSYGDSCLNGDGALIETTRLDRLIAFDPEIRTLRAEAGASLSDILSLVVPHGLFLPTTPGTRFVTLGGAVANDVHGKNHHRAGAFGRHVRAIGLLRGDGRRLVLSPTEEPDLFAATIAGLGLTGVIEWVEIGLVPIPSARLDVESIRFASLDGFWDLARASVDTHEHTVAWIDSTAKGATLGRGIFVRANWRDDDDLMPHQDRSWMQLPIDAPSFLLNVSTVRAFNEFYFWQAGSRERTSVAHYERYFYPLDTITNWNRLYGHPGFYQYQCVVPAAAQEGAVSALLGEIGSSGEVSFLAVLKTFGDFPSPGLLSFPRGGATLALDFPNRGARTLLLMERLDAIVRDAGGALYPAKDGRMSAAMFRAGYPNWEKFSAQIDPVCGSDFWRRMIT
jgi:FAD/FMN-containing dehydrogenase